MRYKNKKQKTKKVKNEAGERYEKGKNACSFYWIQSSLQRREGEGREAGQDEVQKRATTTPESAAKAKPTTQEHLFPRRAWNFERDAVSKWEQGHV
jgi:hypothetical protein